MVTGSASPATPQLNIHPRSLPRRRHPCGHVPADVLGGGGDIDGDVSLDDKQRNVNSRQENPSLRRT